MLVQVTPIAIDAISWKYFLIFVIFDCIFIVIAYLFYPETKNKTLEELEALFGDKVCILLIQLRPLLMYVSRSRRASRRPVCMSRRKD